MVQGVGLRPFVRRLADELGLAGQVANRGGQVELELEGPPGQVQAFLERLQAAPPAGARLDELRTRELAPRGEQGFLVLPSDPDAPPGELPPDRGPCAACLEELGGPGRRAEYPFTTCTACGPRWTITRGLPYDRVRTAMAGFALCAACEEEYRDPAQRRFHVEAQCCPTCGPRLDMPLGEALAVVRGGGILALQGVGGWQLLCLAREDAIARLRARKGRPEKPLALCARDLEQVAAVAELVPGAAEALTSPARPIVLLPARPGRVAPSVAPGLREVGVMLPASPLHALLLREAEAPWVLTSGNLHGAPIEVDGAAARERLRGVADAFLGHDRPILARADDSVVRLHRGSPRLIRRARGYVPASLPFPHPGPDVLALGGDLKAAPCVIARGRAVLGAHVGDLSHPEAEQALREGVAHLLALTGAAPRVVACDLHPDYASSRLAREQGLPVLEVQHHHAHAAACLAEHGRTGPALALALDGSGHGADSAPWGGELLWVDLRAARRLGRLRPVALPGGDRAAREPWRCALAHLADAGIDDPGLLPVDPARQAQLRALLARGVHSPLASSAGRLFDAAAALCGVCVQAISYEGQAAMQLEALAAEASPVEPSVEPYPHALRGDGELLELDTRPLLRALVDDRRAGVDAARAAARFHAGLAAGLAAAVARLGHAELPVLLVGGVFQNHLLLALSEERLRASGREVLYACAAPAGDGGLSLGQAAVAAARLRAD